MKSRVLFFIALFCFCTKSFSEFEEIKTSGKRTIITNDINSKRIIIEDIHTDKECLFAGTHRYYKIKEAKNDARRNYYDRNYYIYIIGNGLGPEVPDPDHFDNLICEDITIERKVLWVGSDSLACKNHSKMEKKAFNYAKKFNSEMITTLKENGLCK